MEEAPVNDVPEQAPEHELAVRAHWPWLPHQRSSLLTPHAYCRHCGLVRCVGSDRPLDLGGLTNLLSKLSYRLAETGVRLTEAQRRLVVQRIQRQGIDDGFGLRKQNQLDLFADVVGDCLGVSRHVLKSYLRSD